MRILILSNLYPPHTLGGYEILCGQVCEELQRRGHTLHVLTSDHGIPPGAHTSDPAGVERTLQLFPPFERPPRRNRLQRAWIGRQNEAIARSVIDRFRPDLIFVWSLLRLTVGPARAAEQSGIPVAYTLNDENLQGYLAAPFRSSPRALAAWAADCLLPEGTLTDLKFDHATCISALLKTNLLERGIAAERAEVIYQGIPIERFPLKERPGAIQRPARLLYTGQLHRYKGVHTLIDAAHRLSARGYEIHVTLVGDGPSRYRAELRELARSGKAHIAFPGKYPHEAMPAVYRDQDLLVFPSIWAEPFGLTHLEAMASGLPVVSTGNGGQGEFLRHEVNALLFPEEDAEGLATQIARLLGSPELARRLACQGRQTVEEDFTLSGYVTRLESFLERSFKGARL